DWAQGTRARLGGKGRGTKRQPTSGRLANRIRATSRGIADDPIVVPDIPVIHSLITKNFASATRNRGACSLGDRDGGPGLPKSRQREAGAAGDQRSDLRRQAEGRISVLLGASREEAPEEMIFLSCDAAPDFQPLRRGRRR